MISKRTYKMKHYTASQFAFTLTITYTETKLDIISPNKHLVFTLTITYTETKLDIISPNKHLVHQLPYYLS